MDICLVLVFKHFSSSLIHIWRSIAQLLKSVHILKHENWKLPGGLCALCTTPFENLLDLHSNKCLLVTLIFADDKLIVPSSNQISQCMHIRLFIEQSIHSISHSSIRCMLFKWRAIRPKTQIAFHVSFSTTLSFVLLQNYQSSV